jgi:hypothetical protein
MPDTDHCKNLYLCQILPSLIRDISLSDRKKIFKSCSNSNESKEKDVRIFDHKGRNQHYPIREVSSANRPGSALSSVNPWLEYPPHHSKLEKHEYHHIPSVLETDDEMPTHPRELIVKYTDNAILRSETVNNYRQSSIPVIPKPALRVLKVKRTANKSSQLVSRPPLHFPKYIVQKKHMPCDELPFAFNGPVPISTIKEYRKPTFLEKRMLKSVTGMSIDVLENISVKFKRQQVIQDEYSKNLKTVERIKTDSKLGKWILSQNKK